jgi:nitrilase
MPQQFQELIKFDMTDNNCIIDPRGQVIAGPVEGESILVAEASLDLVRTAKASIDIAGHYSRPDVLKLVVVRSRSPHEIITRDRAVPKDSQEVDEVPR